MKKTILASALGLIITGSAFAQPVSDRSVIPLGVTLVQILRIHITNGGNIEFVFNSINDYKLGIANGAVGLYDTDVVIASSTDWDLHMGAEDAGLMAVDNNPNPVTASIALNNIGVTVAWTGDGTPAYGVDIIAGTGYPNAGVNDLVAFTGVMLTDGLMADAGTVAGSGGDNVDLAFTLNWECGTMAGGGMNATSILAQSPAPQRYATNVFLDLVAN